MKLTDIRRTEHEESTDPIIRQAHDAAKRTRSADVVAALQRTTEAYLSESTARHQAQGGYGYSADDLVSQLAADLGDE